MEAMSEHTYKQFDIELESLRTRVLQMGGLVEQQVKKAMQGLYAADTSLLEAVVREDARVNQLEIELDEACNQVIAKRQPTAIDLRMITTVIKAISDLERIGDKAHKIGRLGLALNAQHTSFTPDVELRHMADLSLEMLHTALDAFARLNVTAAAEVVHQDEAVNVEYSSVVRQLITYMMEDPRTISRSLDIMSIAKAIERVGDHAKNIAEYVIYMVKGLNVRHATLEEIDREIANS
ncbi:MULTISPECIES: phosphate signaling complex protein PhoU [Azospira]|jgi:phosphate transport system protein|uniref:Phosphate-specific transport system accessory protein PhoU n=2 Tax=Azospira oryzae TaxID=146939 RepID=G8QPQ3_AZOOP|nr:MULTISPECIES: phosphate signaling complex protein PhoU [Azospira]AEV25962.1 phosphate transport system regulatory protein PhoU [Azospira oryzae PS]RZT75774.1 PhoU-like phosphate uptake regulator [Azospira oryzae]BBN90196.1 transporter [Azospira sp. I09]